MSATAARPKADAARVDGLASPYRCRKCAFAITDAAARRDRDGRHVHLRLNPHAFAFLFGCFSSAPGVEALGAPTADASWFSGCLWQYAHCRNCGTHLGWVFSGADAFVGLVLERLTEPSP